MSFYIPGTQTISNSNNLVGINTLNPNYTLDVNGDINFTNQLLKNGSPFLGQTGPQGPTGAGGALGYYGSFYDTTTQVNTGGNTGYAMRYNSTLEANGVSIVDGTKITFSAGGVYNIQFSAQFAKTDSGTDYVDIWLRQNGTNVPNSNTRLRSTGNDDQFVASWNFMQTVSANDYLQLMWSSADTAISILANSGSATIPGIPSVILTVQQVMYTQLGPTGPSNTVYQEGPIINITTGTLDNYLLSSETFFIMSGAAAPCTISGFQNGINGRFITLINNSASTITFVNESASSSASNRFYIYPASTMDVKVQGTISFIYVSNILTGRWVMTSNT